MKIKNNTLILDNNDINTFISYNEDKELMFKNFKEQLSKNIKLSSCKKIRIPSNIYHSNIKEEYNIVDLIDIFHSFGPDLFPYQGFEVNNLSLDQFNDIIEEYLKNNLSIEITCSDDFNHNSRYVSIGASVILNGKEISSRSDSFSISYD